MFNHRHQGNDEGEEDLGRYFGIPGQFFDAQTESDKEKTQMDRKRFLSTYWSAHPCYTDSQPQDSPFGPVPRRLEKCENEGDMAVPPELADHILSYSEGFELNFRNSAPFPAYEKGQNYEIRGEMTFVPAISGHNPVVRCFDLFGPKTEENTPKTGQKHRFSGHNTDICGQNPAIFTPAEPSKRTLEGQPFALYTSEKYGCVLFCDRSIAIDLDGTP